MNRRDFMTQASMAGLAMLALPLIPASAHSTTSPAFIQAEVMGRKLKGTRDGRVLESLDGGQTWLPRANFGKHCAVLALGERQGQLWAQVGLQGHSFYLTSSDALMWYTVEQTG